MKKFAAVAVLLACLSLAVAQDKTTKEDKKADEAPAPVVVKGQLPRYFKQLGLSDQQKKEVFKVRAAYAAKIAKLNEEIAALQSKKKEDTEAVFFCTQMGERYPIQKVKELMRHSTIKLTADLYTDPGMTDVAEGC